MTLDLHGIGAVLSECGRYRWLLWRVWDSTKPLLVWIMLNPSTADATEDDATIRVCIGRAKYGGYGGIVVVNLFAWRSTYPNEFLTPYAKAADIVGHENDAYIKAAVAEVVNGGGKVVAAWGMHGALVGRAAEVLAQLDGVPIWCLGKTKQGEPRHPLRIAYKTPLQTFRP